MTSDVNRTDRIEGEESREGGFASPSASAFLERVQGQATQTGLLARFSRAMDRIGLFEPDPRLAVAVSGGPDSLALMLLSALWISESHAGWRGGRLHVLTVDHRLRPESADEAEFVRQVAERAGLSSNILTWDRAQAGLPTQSEPPGLNGSLQESGSLQARAREARYGLLEGWCRENGVLHLLLGHHRDDQVETVCMRAEAGSGADGLAGMAAVRERPDLRLLRPMLGMRKQELEDFLKRLGQTWCVDPGNYNPRYWRGSWRTGRQAADSGGPEGRPPYETFFTLSGKVQRASRIPGPELSGLQRARREQKLARAVAGDVRFPWQGAVSFTPGILRDLLPDEKTGFAGEILRHVSGAEYRPRTRKIQALLELIEQGDFHRASVACCLVQKRHARKSGGDGAGKGRILVFREPGTLGADVAVENVLAQGSRVARLWDRRFLPESPGLEASGTPVGPLFVSAPDAVEFAAFRRQHPGHRLWQDMPAIAGLSLPGLRDSGGNLLALHGGEASGSVLLRDETVDPALGGMRFRFCPVRPMLFSCFVAA